MKKLIFIRHAKAEEPSSEIGDFERSLTTKGKNVARLMAEKLIGIEKSPALMITSPAFRAIETAIIFAGKTGIKADELRIESEIYSNMSYQYFENLLESLNEDIDTVYFFGHNPSFSQITNTLCRGGCDFMPKCGIAAISFNNKTWSEIRRGTGNLEYFLKPDKSL